MAELGDLISVMLAISTDEAKGARLRELQAKHDELDAAIARDEQLVADAHAAAAKAAALHEQAAAMVQHNSDRSAALDQREAEMGRVLKDMNEEKAKFEAIRKTVENEQSSRRLDIEASATALSDREKAVSARERALVANEGIAERLSRLAAWKIERLREALEDVPPES
jgi:hypothetical protein